MKLDPRRIKITTQPTSEPITLDEAKEHLHIVHSNEDVFITGLIMAARIHCENIARRAFVTRSYTAYSDCWPRYVFELPYPPLVSVTSIKYYDDEGSAAATFSSSNYYVDTNSEPGRVALINNADWPDVTLREINGVEIIYVAGYSDADDVPETYKAAIKLVLADLYENREGLTVGQGLTPIVNKRVEDLLLIDRG